LFVGVFCTSKAHCFDDSSSLLPFGVDVRRVVSFLAVLLLLNCLQPPTFMWSALSSQRPFLTTETLREPTFFVVLFDPHAAKRVGLSLQSPCRSRRGLRICKSRKAQICTFAVTGNDPATVEASVNEAST
jgi:hypothetical protein